jgi:hypothetical protein
MAQRRRETRLVEEHLHEAGVLRHARQDALQDDELLEAGGAAHAREIDLAIPEGELLMISYLPRLAPAEFISTQQVWCPDRST